MSTKLATKGSWAVCSLVAVLSLALGACLSDDGRRRPTPGVGSPAPDGGGVPDPGHGGASMPAELVASWYTGSGYTSAPYDPGTGSWGRPNGMGLIYVFSADGSYLKAFQSYASNGGCTTGFTAFEEGVAVVVGSELTTRPTSGHMVYEDTCVPSSNSDTPLTDLADETFSFHFEQDEYDPSETVLVLLRTDGAGGTFRRL